MCWPPWFGISANWRPRRRSRTVPACWSQGDGAPERIVDTGKQWKCVRDAAYSPAPRAPEMSRFYYVAGPGDQVQAKLYPWGWEQAAFDDSGWPPAAVGSAGSPRDAQDGPNSWMLVPRSIPPMELTPQPITLLRSGNPAHEIPPHTSVTLLYDQTFLTTGYPQLTLSGGQDAKIDVGYAEALWLPGLRDKGNRNEIEGKQFIGAHDVFIADGGQRRRFEPLWWRTWRYLAADDRDAGPAALDRRSPRRLHWLSVRTESPLRRRLRRSSERSSTPAGAPRASARTKPTWIAPTTSSLQYAGDTRVQALVSLYMTGDGRLMRNAIELLDSSRSAEGATYSRAPSRLQQYIPPFSLWWIGMLHDYWMYQDDPAFVARMLPGVRAVLWFFAAHQQAGRFAGPAAVVEFRGLDQRVGWRCSARTRHRPLRAARPAIAARISVGRGDGSRLGNSGPGRRGSSSGGAPARFRAPTLLGRRTRALRRHIRRSANTRSRPTRWRCWPALAKAPRRTT